MDPSTTGQSASVKIVHDFHQTLQSIVSQQCLKEIISELDEVAKLRQIVAQLEEQIRSKESTHKERVDKIKLSHVLANKEFLGTHREVVAESSEKQTSLSKANETLVEQLQQEKNSCQKQIDQTRALESNMKTMIKQSKDREQRIVQLETELGKANEQTRQREKQDEKIRAEYEAIRDRSIQLEKSVEGLRKEKALVTKQLQSASRELEKVKSYYSNEIHREEPKTDVFERLSRSFQEAVMSCFGENLAENILRNPRPWNNFRKNAISSVNIPLPESNTPAAKYMRAVAALSILAHRLATRLFQPFYHGDDSSLRFALVEEAESNPEKELLCRALVLSLSPQEQADYSQEIVSQIIKEMTILAGWLMPSEKVHEFAEKLRPIMEEALKVWKHIQRCRAKVEADVDLDEMAPWPWRTISNSVENPLSNEDEDADKKEVLVVFPRIYVINTDGYQQVFPGLVLRKWQLRSAEEEMERLGASTRTLVGARRRMSIPPVNGPDNRTNGVNFS